MLIEFSVANFLSIKDRQTLRMDAASISDYPERVIDAGRHKLLRSAAIYGANASGKSNVLKAIGTMREILTKSASQSSTTPILVQPFLLDSETEHKPTYFEIVFSIDTIQYRYGFEADQKSIKLEWLFEAKRFREKALFIREGQGIEIAKDFKEGKNLEEKTRDNALFLAVCDQFNGRIARSLFKWFNKIGSMSGVDHREYREDVTTIMNDPQHNGKLLGFLGSLNLGFEGIQLDEDSETRIWAIHNKYNLDKTAVGKILFDLDLSESSGTQKLFDVIGPVFLATIRGGVLTIDELDAKLHPLLTQAIIRLFNNPATNPNNAQLIFATHDTNLLTYGQFRRDQIWFTEKDKYGATCLYSLVEYQEEDGTKVRKDRSFETDYIQGRYGAIPYIGDFSKLFQDGSQREN